MLERKRHLRGTWISSVINLDWPSKKTWMILNDAERASAQKKELICMLDEAVSMGMNAVFFQVKPCSDVLYRSALSPWSSYLTGTLGKNPGYDPLQFVITEAHRRNLELHARFAPCRVSMDTEQSTIDALRNVPFGSPASVYAAHPDWIGLASDKFVVDPGIPAVRDWIIQGLMEVVEKYDIDGIQFDDYFYDETSASTLDDDFTFSAYGGDFAHKSDWRRNNTFSLMTELSRMLRSVKPHIKFGISSTDVWRNNVDDCAGSDNSEESPTYEKQYVDTRLWILEELIDYIVHQVSPPFTEKVGRFDIAAESRANIGGDKNIHLYIAEAPSNPVVPSNPEPDSVADHGIKLEQQIDSSIDRTKIRGHIFSRHFCARGSVAFAEKANIQPEVRLASALIPSMPWKGNKPPNAPINIKKIVTPEGIRLQWESRPNDGVIYYAVYRFTDGKLINIDQVDGLLVTVRRIGEEQSWTDTSISNSNDVLYAVTALDRNHNESTPCEVPAS